MKAVQSRGSQRIEGAVSSRDLSLRTHPLVFGVVVFLASDLMIFGGFIAAYFNLKSLTDAWPPAGVHLDRGPEDSPPAGRVAVFHDPFGHRWFLNQPLD